MNIIWKTEKRSVKDLIPAEYNPRKLTDKEKIDLMNSIKEFNEVEPVIINTNNVLIGGHQRVSIYADLGIEEIDVRVPNRKLELEEEMRLNLRLNKNTGGWDWEKLNKMDEDLLKIVGFNDDELKINFGLSSADNENIDEDRLEVLMIFPPEVIKLKERIALHFNSIDDYNIVKEAIKEGRLNANSIIKILAV